MRVRTAGPGHYLKKTTRKLTFDIALISGLEIWKMLRPDVVLMIKWQWPWWVMSLQSGGCMCPFVNTCRWALPMRLLSIYSSSKMMSLLIGNLVGLRNWLLSLTWCISFTRQKSYPRLTWCLDVSIFSPLINSWGLMWVFGGIELCLMLITLVIILHYWHYQWTN
jgi:hypothetical protein